jgi:hypothetical protein
MTEELVEKLRNAVTYGYMPRLMREVAAEAADAIEALQAENSMLAAGACINPGQHALVGDEHGNFVCTAYEALQAEERAHADALAKVAELESWKVAEEAHHHLLRADVRRLTNELQAHKDALAQVKGSSYD